MKKDEILPSLYVLAIGILFCSVLNIILIKTDLMKYQKEYLKLEIELKKIELKKYKRLKIQNEKTNN